MVAVAKARAALDVAGPHMKKDCPLEKAEAAIGDNDWRKLPAPKDGEPTKKTIKGGKIIYYCSKCKRNKGCWNDNHETKDHVVGWLKKNKKDEDGNPSANIASVSQEMHSTVSSWFDTDL
jgi:hypothetical protein